MSEYREFSVPEDVAEWVEKHYSKSELDQFDIKLNPESTLAEYKGSAYCRINEYVRRRIENQQEDFDIVGLKRLLCSKKVPESIIVYRYVSLKEWWVLFKGTMNRKKFTYPSFLSTTMLKSYYSMEEIKKNRLAVKIFIPQGTPGTYLPEVNSKMPEYEILMPYHLSLKKISWNTYEIVK